MEHKKDSKKRKKKLENKPINFGKQRDLVKEGIQKSMDEYLKMIVRRP